MPGIYRLKGTVKHYDWGGFSFIPSLLQTDNKEVRPFAEYWLGVHEQDNCVIELPGPHRVLLKEFMQENRNALGNEVLRSFGRLPYLLKILDVHKMLSIQVHPSKAGAEKEFARENAEGIALDSLHRNYKDDNHKPELLVALGDFWLLHGFKSTSALRIILETVPELTSLLTHFETGGYEGLYKWVMTMPQEEVNHLLQPLLNRVGPLYQENKLDRSQEDFWAARAALNFPHHGKSDRGIFSIYFFNLLHLNKGEGIFQDAGLPHAYLEGQNVEIMANSDNVLRGGLTNKHIDVKELLKHVKCEPAHVEVLRGTLSEDGEKTYKAPAPDFQLSVFELKAGRAVSFSPVTAEILLLTNGMAELDNGTAKLKLQPGNPSAMVFPGKPVHLSSTGGSTVFRASVAVDKGE